LQKFKEIGITLKRRGYAVPHSGDNPNTLGEWLILFATRCSPSIRCAWLDCGKILIDDERNHWTKHWQIRFILALIGKVQIYDFLRSNI